MHMGPGRVAVVCTLHCSRMQFLSRILIGRRVPVNDFNDFIYQLAFMIAVVSQKRPLTLIHWRLIERRREAIAHDRSLIFRQIIWIIFLIKIR